MSRVDWIRMRGQCPVCGSKGWCTRSADDANVVNCPRTPNAHPLPNGAGYLHKLDGAAQPAGRRADRVAAKATPRLRPDEVAAVAERCRTGIGPARLASLARSLGLEVAVLQRLGVGWADGEAMWSERLGKWLAVDAYTFPMRDAAGRTVGIRLRKADGSKFSFAGGTEGLFVPDGLDDPRELHVCEGPTSCAALLQVGYAAVGRPSCAGGAVDLAALVTFGRRKLDVVIWGDHDEQKVRPDGSTFEPGQDGAASLARRLAPACRSVRVVIPPSPELKDPRALLVAGHSRAVLDCLVRAAPYVVAGRAG